MSLNILLIGTSGGSAPLCDALKAGLHEVAEVTADQGLKHAKIQDYSAVIIHLETGSAARIARFVSGLKLHQHLWHIPVIAFLPSSVPELFDAIAETSFDDFFYPCQPAEYQYIAQKITTLYRRLQVLRTMHTRAELLGVNENTEQLLHTQIVRSYALLCGEKTDSLLADFAPPPNSHLKRFQSPDDLEKYTQGR
ncbi:MAG: hypothetical protein HRT36_06170, partial [Alphaproteobacteria bacterium]|nr:hypothetical protein [Alphaproteobacteria bacterium]